MASVGYSIGIRLGRLLRLLLALGLLLGLGDLILVVCIAVSSLRFDAQ